MEYKSYKLDSLCEITSSKRIFYSEYTDSGIPFYRSKEIIDLFNRNDIATELFISEERYNEIKYKFGVPENNDMLLTSVGTIGIPYLVKANDRFYFKDGNLTWFRNYNHDLIAPSYLYLWISSNIGKQTLTMLSMGAAQPALTISRLKNLCLNLPPVEIQQKIASILSTYDTLIENNTKRIRLLEQMAENLYKEWFIRFRFPGHENVEMDNGLPKGWKIEKLGNWGIELDTGSRPKGGIDDSITDGIPSLGAESIKGLAMFDYSSVKLVPIDFYNNLKRGKNTGNDILLYKDGAYIGKVTMFRDGFPFANYSINEHVFFVYPKDAAYQNYLYFTLNQNTYFSLMQNLNRNAAQPGLSRPDVNRIKINIPSIDIIEKFNEFVEPILRNIFKSANQNQLLIRQRDLLLPRLMSGKLEVKP